MDFMKKTLNQVDVHENTLYNIIYDLFFFAKLQESDELEAKYANNNIG